MSALFSDPTPHLQHHPLQSSDTIVNHLLFIDCTGCTDSSGHYCFKSMETYFGEEKIKNKSACNLYFVVNSWHNFYSLDGVLSPELVKLPYLLAMKLK
ncbi:hypothetical protein L1987_57347 [Smallanthus sonchifolius]|uniref:Uncharacterized protein n=1 Tax=Smallanthus sonchifolius TaxID=185202 RepID=A0ACB9DCJ6_9ASTR|nr:hypothetical protein L1987_57347 [Smallanthus sonchifolius]